MHQWNIWMSLTIVTIMMCHSNCLNDSCSRMALKIQCECMSHGLGVRKCEKTAVQWYRLAAEQGDAEAQFCLGNCYQYGQGIEQNDEVVKWFRLATEQGSTDAQYILAYCYYTEEGVEHNYGESVH